MFKNPVPVAVCLLPVEGRLLGVRRGIEPRKGLVALPGGYIDSNETWQEACARELLEETGFSTAVADIKLFSVESAIDSNRLLIFGLAPEASKDDIDMTFKTEETIELSFIDKGDELAFPLHTLVAKIFFN